MIGGGRRLIRIAHAEVDEVGAARAGSALSSSSQAKTYVRQVGQPPCWNQLGRLGYDVCSSAPVVAIGAVQYIGHWRSNRHLAADTVGRSWTEKLAGDRRRIDGRNNAVPLASYN